MPDLAWLIYGMPLALFVGIYGRRRQMLHKTSVATRDAAIAAGLTEPASLHPVIDPNKCIGCGACIKACPEMPEHRVLGLIRGKAELINPTECIGHGACLANCADDAITLVFGTETRGIDIPHVAPNFETNVPGIFIAGELGGMGLIRNAIEQGCQAIHSIHKSVRVSQPGVLDVLIVGAGPAGFAASLAAMDHGLEYVTLEQESLGGTVAHYPRGKLVMTGPAHLPIAGKFRFHETTKEHLLEFWQGVANDTGVQISYGQRVEQITKDHDIFTVVSNSKTYRSRSVLLAIGRRGSPRKLDVPGESLPKVTYRMMDPGQYRGQNVLVVGGGDSAIEAACSLAEQPDAVVTLSYRSDAFSRAKPKNRERIEAAVASGALSIVMNSNVEKISADHVCLIQNGQSVRIDNDAVIINAGGILPTAFLRSLGISVNTKFGTA